MFYSLPRSEVELNIRAVRDHLADCLVLLPDLLKNNNHNSIHFYFANFTGVRRVIFPSLLAAYQQWVTDGDVEKLHNEVNRGRIHWRSTALSILDAFKAQSDAFGAKVAQLVEPKYLG
jgi:hypothetical protein